MNYKPVYCKLGRIPHWIVSCVGEFVCTLDDEYHAVTRIRGRKKKYVQVQLIFQRRSRWFYVHRLMAFSWLGHPRHRLLTIVDHRDGNGLNNEIQNLRWVTSTGNNLNRPCRGVDEINGIFYPRIAGYTHMRYGDSSIENAQESRRILLECYIRYNCKFPEQDIFPHFIIWRY